LTVTLSGIYLPTLEEQEGDEMSESPVRNSSFAQLDADGLANRYRVQTNWHVITGAICSGKTTLINLLAEGGFQTVPEIARQYVEAEMAKGRTLEELFGSEDDERAITELQRRAEKELRPTDVVFLDRALPGYLHFWRLFGMDADELLPMCFEHRYASVFILDQLLLELDGARIDDKAYTDLLDAALVRDYSALGYDVVRVPVMSPQERLEFVLARLARQGLT
jgi:predicted ATPase